jgi:hypothetical protein
MAVNRFLNVNWSQPISSFVPRPFEAAYMAGKQAQEELDSALKDLDSSTDPFAKLNLSGSIKVWDPNAPKGYSDFDIGNAFEQKKVNTVNALTKERQQIVDDYYNQKIDNNEFNRRIAQHKNKAVTAYNILSSSGAALDKIRKHNEDIISKSKEFGTDPYYGTNMLDDNTAWLNKAMSDEQSGVLPDYIGTNIADKFDSATSINEHTDKWKTYTKGISDPVGGYIRDFQQEGIGGTKVYQYAKDNYPKSTDRIYDDMRVRYELHSKGLTGDEPVEYTTYQPKIKNGNYVTSSDGHIIDEPVKVKGTLYEAKMAEKFNQFHDAIAQKIVGFSTTEKLRPDTTWQYLDKKKAIEEQLVAEPADVEAEASIAFQAIPDQIKDFVNPTTGEFDSEYAKQQGKGYSYITDSSGKKHTITSETETYSGTPGAVPAVRYTLPDELKKQGYSINNQTGKVYKNGKLSETQMVSLTPKDPEWIKTMDDESYKWALQTGPKLGILPQSGDDRKTYKTRVLKEIMEQSKRVSVNKKIDAPIAKAMDDDLVGKDGSKFFINYDDIIIPGKEGTKPVKEFIDDNDIDPTTIKHGSMTFDKERPGYVLFSALDKDKNPVQFYAKSRNIDFVKSSGTVNSFINTFKNFYKGDINSKELIINNEKYIVLDKKIAEPTDTEESFLALDTNKVPVLVIQNKTNKGPKFIDIPINELKGQAYKAYFGSTKAKEYTRGIRESLNWMYQGLDTTPTTEE